MRRALLPLLLLCLLAGEARAIEFPPLQSNGVVFGGGVFADSSFEDVAYVSAGFLAELFTRTPQWDPAAQQLRLRDPKGREWSFTLDNPFIAVQGAVYNLTYPVRRGPEHIYLPLHPLLRVLRMRFGIDIMPGSTGILPPVAAPAGGEGHITGMALEETPDGAVLRIQASPGARWQGVLARPHYIVRVFGGSLDPGTPAKLDGAGPLQSVEARQQGNTAQFTLRLRDARDSVELTPEAGGWRVTVRSHVRPVRPATIIVDAGHGGKDQGASVKGVREAEINLAVSLLLRKELEEKGYNVLLTRDQDVFKTLQERPTFASENKGDVFISLHCNSIAGPASRLAQVTGYVAYILREAKSEEDKAIARRENVAIEEQSGKSKKAEISPLDWILLEHQLNQYSKQSEALTESIVKNFSGFDIPKYSTGARQAGFFVLVGAYMPAVLFEMGFLTHDRDRKTLTSRDGQREIARRLAVAIDGFQKSRMGK